MEPKVEYFDVVAKVWERPLDPHTRAPDPTWRVPRSEVKDYILADARRWRVRQIDADPTFFSETMEDLRELGLPVREFWQSSLRNMMTATQGVYDMVMDRRLRHPGERRFTAHIRNAVAKQVQTGSAAWVLRKGLAKRPMDAAVALALAKWGWDNPEKKEAPKKAPGLHLLD
jgi:phage terminase large subunit-like protein